MDRLLLVIVVLVSFWSGHQPHDRFTWWLEVLPVFVGGGVIYARSIRLTTVSKLLIFLWALILLVGGHYTYAEVPAFNWLRDEFHLARNHFDRLGHFAQGFVPAILFREYVLQRNIKLPSSLLGLVCICFALALSASYELIEWWVALGTNYLASIGVAVDGTTEGGATAFLGTQGDVWDTQWDMFCALLGACSALIVLSRVHSEELNVTRDSYSV